MIKVWTDNAEAGFLDRSRERGTTFLYQPEAQQVRAVSVTMPVRLASWETRYGLAPIFEMNLPEGALRERLRLTFAKATGTFDDFDLLTVVGRSQLGRVRYTGQTESLNDEVPFQSVDEILARRREGDLYRSLVERFAALSGISGVQPKILVRDEGAFSQGAGAALPQSYRGATHIVKFWEENEYPQLAANEFFCLAVARQCGLEVPACRLAEDAKALVIDRFDLRADGTYRGFEDFCVLNARRTDEKYSGSYETSILKRFAQFSNSTEVHGELKKLFTLVALNCALRNGDAHLKNFGVVYDDVSGEALLAPVYDLVTTSVYLPKDQMALTLNGTTRWPSAKELLRLGQTRAGLSPAQAREILARIADAMQRISQEVGRYLRENPEFAEVGGRLVKEWEAGRAHSLGV